MLHQHLLVILTMALAGNDPGRYTFEGMLIIIAGILLAATGIFYNLLPKGERDLRREEALGAGGARAFFIILGFICVVGGALFIQLNA